MNQIQSAVIYGSGVTKLSYKPEIFRIRSVSEFEELTQSLGVSQFNVHDAIEGQLDELLKCRYPKISFTKSSFEEAREKHLNGVPVVTYGVWVYYPWSGSLVHLLDEAEFSEVRTNRNMLKITPEEREVLAQKKIGLIGLSVGQSVAMALAMERGFGELRIADFDILELSNLNRIRSSVHQLGLPKATIVAREVAEIDPFLTVKPYFEGITDENIHDFFTDGGNIDLLIEECDGLDIKIKARQIARSLGVPVLMDTSDRGMIDVERFDLEPDRPVLHGLIEHLDQDTSKLKGLTNEEKVPYVLPMTGANKLSARLRASMLEINQSVKTWPQLASGVLLGGAITADLCRKILLGGTSESGRFYIDMNELIPVKLPVKERLEYRGPAALELNELNDWVEAQSITYTNENPVALSDNQVKQLVTAGILAPSGGNAQPWKFVWHSNALHVFHDASTSFSLLDFNDYGSLLSIGGVVANIELEAAVLGWDTHTQWTDKQFDFPLVCILTFSDATNAPKPLTLELAKEIPLRQTNRLLESPESLPAEVLESLQSMAGMTNGAELHFLTEREDLETLKDVVGGAERLRLIHPQGHQNFIDEVRWTIEENETTKDGIDLATLELTSSDLAGLQLASDWNVVQWLYDQKKGEGFEKFVRKSVDHAAAVGLLTMPTSDRRSFYHGGKAVQHIWLKCSALGLGFQPISPCTFLFARLQQSSGDELPSWMKEELTTLYYTLSTRYPAIQQSADIFLFRIFKQSKKPVGSLRRDLDRFLWTSGN